MGILIAGLAVAMECHTSLAASFKGIIHIVARSYHLMYSSSRNKVAFFLLCGSIYN